MDLLMIFIAWVFSVSVIVFIVYILIKPDKKPLLQSDPCLADFVQYCKDHPDQRFWQALQSWSGYAFVYVSDYNSSLMDIKEKDLEDTYYWKGRRKNEFE